LQRATEPLSIARILKVKQRLKGDLAGQGFKFIIDLNRLARGPRVEHLVGQLGHDLGIRLHADLVERGLNELALSMPKRALARTQSVSNHRFEHPCPKVFYVVLGVCHHHLFDEVGPARQEHAPRTKAEARKRTVLTARLEQEVEECGAELAVVTAKQCALWAWWPRLVE